MRICGEIPWLTFTRDFSAEGKMQTLEQREPKSQHEHLILLMVFWQVTSLLKASVSSSRKKETENQNGKYNMT